jgi:hypothetical protein
MNCVKSCTLKLIVCAAFAFKDFMKTNSKSFFEKKKVLSNLNDLYQVRYYQNQKLARLKAFPLISQTSEIDEPSQIMRPASVQLNS